MSAAIASIGKAINAAISLRMHRPEQRHYIESVFSSNTICLWTNRNPRRLALGQSRCLMLMEDSFG